MEQRYRIIITAKNTYKEIEVSENDRRIRFGTESFCDVRVRKDAFFEPIELEFTKDDKNSWSVVCSNNLYIYKDEVSKLMTTTILHGSKLNINYQSSMSFALKVEFYIDFDYEIKDYNRRIDISGLSQFTIGSQTGCNIVLSGSYTSGDQLQVVKNNNQLELHVVSSRFGVFYNGKLVSGKQIVSEGDFFSMANYSFYYNKGFLYTQKSGTITVNGLKIKDSIDKGDYPKFNRNTRVKMVLDDTKIEVLDPPAIPKKPKNNLLTRLLPSVVMILMSIIVGIMGSGVFILISVASAAAGIVTAVIGVRQANADFKRESKERISKYNAYINRKKNEINKARNDELSMLQSQYIAEDIEVSNLKRFSFELFDRCPEDDDFLHVRLGLGKRESVRIVDYKKQERLEIEDELQEYPQKLAENYKYIDAAPIICDFKKANAVGIIGQEKTRFSILKNILVDICARQFHSDVKMFFVGDEKHSQQLTWLRMLPHVHNENLGIHNIVCDENSRTVIFEYLYKELTLREQQKIVRPHNIIFLYNEFGFKNHPVSKFVENAKDLGVTFVFFGDSRADIGLGCDYLIQITGEGRGELIDTSDSKKTVEFSYNSVDTQDVAAMVDMLSPVYTEEISLEGSLTKNISLFELLNILSVDDIDLASAWSSSKVYQTMAAPVGVSKSGVIYLDLHDKAHGPHGLVAGTTGAGKSELLQTYIMSMAVLYHPYEVGFVIIDFKGGGMANQFRDLPHLIGTITNIDGRAITRSLKSIKAELRKRQRLFAEADVNHIDKYIIKYKSGEVEVPLPHLILIVDEFAELKAEQPDFMKELISAARIGRSLGVHLILATQKPSGQVDEQIWSNSRFKLCLKVQSQSDSNEVLKSPLAAEIKEPGRAYLQVGNNEIFELFQSAYSGAPEHSDDSMKMAFTFYEITDSGKRIAYRIKEEREEEGKVTQIEALVDYIKSITKQLQISKLQPICLPELGEKIMYSDYCNVSQSETSQIVEWGIYDDPDNQIQDICRFNLTENNVMIIGSAQTGKTNILHTIIRALSSQYSPLDVNIYIMDFGSMIMKNYEKLNHVGGVVLAHEEEKCKNLFKMLFKEIELRKERMAKVGVSSFSSYREAGYVDLPQIVLLIDNLTILRELYLLDNDYLLPICRDGLSMGISVVATNSQTNGIGYKYLSNFEKRVALYCNDSGEYNFLFEHCHIHPSQVSGRCLVSIENTIYEAQSFLAFEGEKEIDRIQVIMEFIDNINHQYDGKKAVQIPFIPDVLTENDFVNKFGACVGNNQFGIGLNFSTVLPIYFNWNIQTYCGIFGQKSKSKNNFLLYLKKYLCESSINLYIIDDYTGYFDDIASTDNVELYSRSSEDIGEILDDIKQELADRYSQRDIQGMSIVESMMPLVLIVHNNDVIDSISSDTALMSSYKEILSRYKGLKVCIIYTNLENEPITFNSPEVLKMMRDNRQFIAFEELSEIKLFDVPTSIMKKFPSQLKDEEGYFVSGNELTKFKTVNLLNES